MEELFTTETEPALGYPSHCSSRINTSSAWSNQEPDSCLLQGAHSIRGSKLHADSQARLLIEPLMDELNRFGTARSSQASF
jgi:hypothetical protein